MTFSPWQKHQVSQFHFTCDLMFHSLTPTQLLLQEGEGKTGKTCALDCGAGIGRITKRLLLPLFNTVDMVDVTQEFLDKAKTYLGEESKRIGNYICKGLQDFVPESGRYDVIWIQWVIGKSLLVFYGCISTAKHF